MENKITKADILVVDDTPANLKLLSSMLGANGYKVRPASSGAIALRSVESKLPDLILLDIRMPDMDGFEVCTKLKENPYSKDIPVIFISAMDDIRDKVKAFNVGGIDYVTKPFEPEEVLARISTHVSLRSLQTEMQEQNILLKELMKKQQEQEQVMIEQSRMAAMGEMISAIAHQWRQPLNILALYIQDMNGAYEEGSIDEKYVDKIVSNSMKQINFMSSTIDDFRNFFTPNKEKENFSIIEQLNKTIDLLRPQLKAHNIVIELNNNDCSIWGYPNEFQQVALNLINNAKDAILENQQKNNELNGLIKIDSKQDGSNYQISFLDNGGGIEESILHKIFEPYFTTKFPQNGTGVGLYMVKEIIGRHYNGSVTVANKENGAEFTILIPLNQEEHCDD